jgi:hypothetical protein
MPRNNIPAVIPVLEQQYWDLILGKTAELKKKPIFNSRKSSTLGEFYG